MSPDGSSTANASDDATVLEIGLIAADLVQGWHRCGMAADFFARFLACDDADAPRLRSVLSSVFNEVIENAAKYALEGPTPIRVRAWRAPDHFGIETRHPSEAHRIARLERWLAEREQARLEAVLESTARGDRTASGLGLLALGRDYGATIEAEVASMEGGVGEVVVRVRLPGAP